MSPSKIKFTKKPAKHGGYYIFHIPNSYIKNGLIDPEKIYTVYIEEAKETESEDED
jgi:hypothetical protein